MYQRLVRISCAVALGLTISTSAATAADLWGPREHGSIKDEAPYHQPFSWTGFYLGGHAGLGVGNADGRPETFALGGAPAPIQAGLASFFSTDYEMSGALYGGHVGYNFQTGAYVFGIEGSLSGSSINGDGPAGLGVIVSETDLNWLATVTGRIGYAMGKSLIYARGGVAWGEIESNVRLGGITVLESDKTHVGWTAGFGFEHAIAHNITLRLEYMHTDLGGEDHNLSYNGALGGSPGAAVVGADIDTSFDTLNLGVSFKF